MIILDEPSQGLAPLIVREVFHIVRQMRAEGIAVLLVEQNARMSLEIADHAYVLDDGAIVYSGSASELAADVARAQALQASAPRNGRLPSWDSSTPAAMLCRSSVARMPVKLKDLNGWRDVHAR